MPVEKKVRDLLITWAKTYHTAEFIAKDPVQFPHRYSAKCDIEISGFLTSFLSFGNRSQILKFADRLDAIMQHSPKRYLMSKQWKKDFLADNKSSFYRTIPYAEMNGMFKKLFSVYNDNEDLEAALFDMKIGMPIVRLCRLLGVSDKSPQKKLNMFLRWMIRKASPVDFGIWTKFSPADLMIPLDTHVVQVAAQLGLTKTASYTLNNAKVITSALAEVFPGDPCMGDFALFGYGVTQTGNDFIETAKK